MPSFNSEEEENKFMQSFKSEEEEKMHIFYNSLQDDINNLNESFVYPNNDNKNEEDRNKQSTEAESKKNSEKAENTEESPTDNTEIKTKEKEIISNNCQTPINYLTLNMIDLKIDDEESKEKGKNMLKKKRGRKIKGSGSGEHNKYSDDNLRRKVKHLVLKNTFDFINDKISSIYNQKVDRGIKSIKLLTIKQDQISNATILFNKKFLNKKIGDIFSVDISTRYTNFLNDHNKNLINSLLNEEDENKREYFTGLFSLKFIDCLKQFRGSDNYYYLNGMTTFDEIKHEFENDKDYLDDLTKYIFNYERILANKNERTSIYDEI